MSVNNKSYDELVQLRQDGKITNLLFIMDSDLNFTFLDWCVEMGKEPSDSSASEFLEEFEYDMFETQSNVNLNGFFSL